MRLSAVFAFMAVSSVLAYPLEGRAGNEPAKSGQDAAQAKEASINAAMAAKKAKGKAAADAAANSTASATSTSGNSTSASSTSTAGAVTRTRACDMGDQSLAAGLQASVLVGIGQQASVATLQATNNSADFTTGVTRLQQFIDTQAAQLTMATGIADDGSFAQVQLKLLAASQTSQATAVKALTGSAQTDAAALTSLLASFVTSTNNAQDGAEQALIDCFTPPNAVSG